MSSSFNIFVIVQVFYKNKGDNASIKNVIDLQEEWVKHSQTFNNK